MLAISDGVGHGNVCVPGCDTKLHEVVEIFCIESYWGEFAGLNDIAADDERHGANGAEFVLRQCGDEVGEGLGLKRLFVNGSKLGLICEIER